MVVAELRPSPDSAVRRIESRPAVLWVTPQPRQNPKLPGMYQPGTPSEVDAPSPFRHTWYGWRFL